MSITSRTGTGTPPGGGILQGAGVTRINAQPSLSAIPSGFFADKGKTLAARSNGKTYGWDTAETANAMARHQHPLPQFDTFIQFGTAAGQSTGTWKITSLTPSTTYAVVVVMGDAASTNQTDDITIQGLVETDATPAQVTPPDYHRGNFDGYAETVTVAANGTLTIAARATAVNPKLCFLEIGPPGSVIAQADRDRLAAAIKSANDATGMPAFPKAQPTPRLYAYGSYVDEPLALVEGATKTKYYYAKNHLYSVAALTDATGAVVERYKYDAYGRQGILAGNGVVSYTPSDYGQFIGFTGRYGDWETGLMYFRARYYDTNLGRFIGRDSFEYVNGFSLYQSYFSVNLLDPTGHEIAYCGCGKDYDTNTQCCKDGKVVDKYVLAIRAYVNHAWISFYNLRSKTTRTISNYFNHGRNGTYWDQEQNRPTKFSESDEELALNPPEINHVASRVTKICGMPEHMPDENACYGPFSWNCASVATWIWNTQTGEHLDPQGWTSWNGAPGYADNPVDLRSVIVQANSSNPEESYEGGVSNVPYADLYNPPDTHVGNAAFGANPDHAPSIDNRRPDGIFTYEMNGVKGFVIPPFTGGN